MIVWLYWLNQNDSSLYHRILAGITAVSLWPTISDKSLPRKVFLYKNFSVIYRCFAHHFPQLLSEHKQGDPDSIVAVDKTEMFVEFHRTEKEREKKNLIRCRVRASINNIFASFSCCNKPSELLRRKDGNKFSNKQMFAQNWLNKKIKT